MATKRDLVRDCINCVHCKENLAYEECKKRTKSKIIYNGLKEAESCSLYEQKGGGGDEKN